MTDTPTPADVARATYAQGDVAAQIADLERELAAARHDALIARVMADYGLTSEDALLLTGEDEATVTAQARRLKERTGDGERRAPTVRQIERMTYEDDTDGWP
ncbi:hypothetical protein HR12_23485 [Microbacterium sp. SUBG005]|nr:hypothetical protein HR12_39335 [Microbacterium sp. SUBG005]KEP75773.1 hypothetical protein HR12_23485 [Microbacterium sp. SUBG005]